MRCAISQMRRLIKRAVQSSVLTLSIRTIATAIQ